MTATTLGLPAGRRWRTRHGQVVRIYPTSVSRPDYWQWSLDHHDITDGAVHNSPAEAGRNAVACLETPPRFDKPHHTPDYPWAAMGSWDLDYLIAHAAWWFTCNHAVTSRDAYGSGCRSCRMYWTVVWQWEDAARADLDRARAEGWEPVRCIAREALCNLCGQSYNPQDGGDLIHIQTTVPVGETWLGRGRDLDLPEGGERYCGGLGEIIGSWG